MEVGAVKQAFNNEVILLKKSLNQARIQVIHKLTRKAKTLTQKKLPEKLQSKIKKKAESAVKEVLIIKKIKAKDLAKFIVTHKAELNTYLNKPEVDHDKACARLLLHKSLQAKYKSLRSRFGNSAIDDLFMSRLERRKLKKEAREKQKNKKKAKEDKNKVVNGDSVWDVEEIDNTKPMNNQVSDNEVMDIESEDDNQSVSGEPTQSDEELEKSSLDRASENSLASEKEGISEDESEDIKSDIEINEVLKNNNNNASPKILSVNAPILETTHKSNNTVHSKIAKEKKKKDFNKNKNFNDKILNRNFNKGSDEKPTQEVKVVDPFFITSTGENYISVVEPRQPDEVKEVHKQGNRKYRRAVMFGHVPPKPRKDTYNQTNNNRKFGGYSDNKRGFNNVNDRSNDNQFKRNNTGNKEIEKEEKLHPSWAAKKKVSSLLPFEGRKIVFNDDD